MAQTDVRPVRIIIEGVNYCGKDAIIAALKPLCKNAIIVMASGYYRSALDHLGAEALSRYFKGRSEAYLPIIGAIKYEELIIVRLHLTDVVYCGLYLEVDQDYFELEARLDELKVGLVLLDVDDATLAARQAANPRGQSGHADRPLQALINKRDRFRHAFNASRMSHRLCLNNSNGEPTLDEQARKILEWWQRLQ